MARGTANNEPVVSQANSKAFDAGYDRVFGADKKPQRGRWIQDPHTGELVDAADYRPPPEARNAPIISDRIHEGTRFDGEDVGSRRARREFMARRGVTDASDFSPSWYEGRKSEIERDQDRTRHQDFERAAREVYRRNHGRFR